MWSKEEEDRISAQIAAFTEATAKQQKLSGGTFKPDYAAFAKTLPEGRSYPVKFQVNMGKNKWEMYIPTAEPSQAMAKVFDTGSGRLILALGMMELCSLIVSNCGLETGLA